MPEIEEKQVLYSIEYSNRFKKDVKLAGKRNLDLSLLKPPLKFFLQQGNYHENTNRIR
jgi:mRNA-degrading endonuclease YafQ of YafQ-DinJ toxin-antitoxin module